MTGLQIFDFNGCKVRMLNIDGEIMFVAKDVAQRLGYKNPSEAVRDNCKKAINLTTVSRTVVNEIKELQRTKSLLIPESDVYLLIMNSRLPEAIAFQDWLCEEVLPSIRKTGKYSLRSKPTPSLSLLDFEDPAAAAIAWAKEYEARRLAAGK